jgi:hypothetical protein
MWKLQKECCKDKIEKQTSGIVYSQDSMKKADWYKFTNTKNRKIKFIYAGGVTSGSINVSIYNSAGKKMGAYYLMPTKDASVTYKLKNVNKSQTIPKGTYYIKVTKSRKETADVYDLKFY